MSISSPYDVSLSDPKEGLIRQELITYQLIDGKLIKNVVIRTFFKNDYIDSQLTIPLTF